MRSEIETLLTISEFSRIMGLHSWYLAQFGFQSITPSPAVPFPTRKQVRTDCQNPTFEYESQDEKLNRFEIARAINEAENAFALEANYWPAPKYIVDEQFLYPRFYDRSVPYNSGLKSDSLSMKEVNLKWGYVQSVGVKALTLVDDNVSVSYNIPAGINYTFTASVVVPAGTLPSEVVAFFKESDRLNEDMDKWQIRPINVKIVGVNATITGDAFLLANPAEYLAYAPIPLVIEEPTHFVTAIEVWIETVDEREAGSFYWSNGCNLELELGCFPITNSRTSKVVPTRARLEDGSLISVQNGCQITCGSEQPKSISINYLAGYKRANNGNMDFIHAQRISWLAAANLKCKPCGCACGGKTGEKDNTLAWWTEIPKVGENLDRIAVTYEDLNNPFGPARGAIKTWRSLKNTRIVKGVAL